MNRFSAVPPLGDGQTHSTNDMSPHCPHPQIKCSATSLIIGHNRSWVPWQSEVRTLLQRTSTQLTLSRQSARTLNHADRFSVSVQHSSVSFSLSGLGAECRPDGVDRHSGGREIWKGSARGGNQEARRQPAIRITPRECALDLSCFVSHLAILVIMNDRITHAPELPAGGHTRVERVHVAWQRALSSLSDRLHRRPDSCAAKGMPGLSPSR